MYCNIYATTVSCWLYTDDKIRINIYEIQRLIDSVIHNQPQTISPSHFSRERKQSLHFFNVELDPANNGLDPQFLIY